jgi:hypothetical protein
MVGVFSMQGRNTRPHMPVISQVFCAVPTEPLTYLRLRVRKLVLKGERVKGQG